MKKNLNHQKKNTELNEAKRRIKELERELLRKDKALAEMSALVVLKKKWVYCGGTRKPDRDEGAAENTEII